MTTPQPESGGGEAARDRGSLISFGGKRYPRAWLILWALDVDRSEEVMVFNKRDGDND